MLLKATAKGLEPPPPPSPGSGKFERAMGEMYKKCDKFDNAMKNERRERTNKGVSAKLCRCAAAASISGGENSLRKLLQKKATPPPPPVAYGRNDDGEK